MAELCKTAIGLLLIAGAIPVRAALTEGISGDLLVEAMLADCRKQVPTLHERAPDGAAYEFHCEEGAPAKIRRLDESSREKLAFELLPSVLDGQMLLHPTAPARGLCGPGTKTRRLAAQVGWGKLSAGCSGGKLEGKFLYRVGESTEEEGSFHQGLLDGDYVQYQRQPIGKHSPERREAHRAGYRLGALDGITRDSDPNGAYVEMSFHEGVLHGPRRAGEKRGTRETVDSETNYADGRVHGTRRAGSLVSTFKEGVLQTTNDPAERAAARPLNEDDPDGGFFLESAHAIALACPPPPPTPPFEGGGEYWDYHCDGSHPDGHVRAFSGGFLRLDFTLSSGRLEGQFRSYVSGTLHTEGAFHSGKPDGLFRRYEQGVLIAEKKFDDGKPDRKTIWHGPPVAPEQRQRRGGTLVGWRSACEDGQVEICLRAGDATRAEGYPALAEPFYRRACELKNGLGCARTADEAYRSLDFSRGFETIQKARKLVSEDELVRWLNEDRRLDRSAARGGLINVLIPGCKEPGPGKCSRLPASKPNREGIHQREALRRVRSAKSKQAVAFDVEKALLSRTPASWHCRAGDRVRVAVFRCAWPAPLDWHGGTEANGLTEGATCLSAGLHLDELLDSVTVVAEHETLAKLPPLFPETRPADLWPPATVIGRDESTKPARPIAVLD